MLGHKTIKEKLEIWRPEGSVRGDRRGVRYPHAIECPLRTPRTKASQNMESNLTTRFGPLIYNRRRTITFEKTLKSSKLEPFTAEAVNSDI